MGLDSAAGAGAPLAPAPGRNPVLAPPQRIFAVRHSLFAIRYSLFAIAARRFRWSS